MTQDSYLLAGEQSELERLQLQSRVWEPAGRRLLSAADAFVTSEGLGNVALVEDDLFASDLEPASFDLVHARFQLSPLGRCEE